MSETDEWLDDEENDTVYNDEQASEPAPASDQNGLLPCPFCGSPAEPYEYKVSKKYVIVCTNSDCLAESGFDLGVSGAVERWNTRPLEQAQAAETERLERRNIYLTQELRDATAKAETLQGDFDQVKTRIYDIAEIELEKDQLSVINFVEWWRGVWSSWQITAENKKQQVAEIERLTAAVDLAIEFAVKYGSADTTDHKDWVIDQMVRALTGNSYEQVVADACAGEDGTDTYEWSVGIAP